MPPMRNGDMRLLHAAGCFAVSTPNLLAHILCLNAAPATGVPRQGRQRPVSALGRAAAALAARRQALSTAWAAAGVAAARRAGARLIVREVEAVVGSRKCIQGATAGQLSHPYAP